jgi:catechol-2,3-dioxygenase
VAIANRAHGSVKKGESLVPKVFRLGYTEFTSERIEPALQYYSDVMGSRLVEQGPDGTHYLSLGLDHHNIALRPAATPANALNGFQVSQGITLESLARDFASHGLAAAYKSDARPGVPALLEVKNVAGYDFEFFTEMATPAPGFAQHGIAPNRLGHIALLSPEAKELERFFIDALGFYATDWFEDMVTFLTCNYDHHVVNLVAAPVTKLHHIAFELRGSAHQYEAADRLTKASVPIQWGPGRHTAGHNYASYHYDPNHTLVELYADLDVYLPDLDCFEPRPWHEQLPQRPRVWPLEPLSAWSTKYAFDMAKA